MHSRVWVYEYTHWVLTTRGTSVRFEDSTPLPSPCKLNFEKKKFFDSQQGSQVRSQNRKTTILGCRTEVFFFVEKKINHSVFWGEIYWRVPWCCNNINIISASLSKVEKTEFFIVFSTFDRDPEIIMKWFQRHGISRKISPQKTIRVS